MRLLLLSLLLTAVACRHTSSPAKVLSEEQMKVIVWDMLCADELAFQNKVADSTLVLKKESFRLYDQVFAIHHVTREQFYSSYRYYQENPAKYKTLMQAVMKYGDQKKATAAPPKLKSK